MEHLDSKDRIKESKINPYIKSIATLAIAIFAFSLVPIFYRISESEISAEATIFNRFWITVLILGIWRAISQLIKTNKTVVESKLEFSFNATYLLLLSLGIIYLLFQLSWSQSLLSTSVANSTVLHNMTPLFIIIYECLFLRYKFEFQRWMPIVIAVIGIFMLGSNDFYLTKDKLIGDFLALLSALFNAFYLLISEKIQKHFDIVFILIAMSIIGTTIAFIILLIEHKPLFPISFYGWLSVVAVAILSQIIGNAFLILSLDVFSPYFVALFLLLDPILSSIEAWIFFGEKIFLFQGLSFFVIISSIVVAINSLSKDKTEGSPNKADIFG